MWKGLISVTAIFTAYTHYDLKSIERDYKKRNRDLERSWKQDYKTLQDELSKLKEKVENESSRQDLLQDEVNALEREKNKVELDTQERIVVSCVMATIGLLGYVIRLN